MWSASKSLPRVTEVHKASLIHIPLSHGYHKLLSRPWWSIQGTSTSSHLTPICHKGRFTTKLRLPFSHIYSNTWNNMWVPNMAFPYIPKQLFLQIEKERPKIYNRALWGKMFVLEHIRSFAKQLVSPVSCNILSGSHHYYNHENRCYPWYIWMKAIIGYNQKDKRWVLHIQRVSQVSACFFSNNRKYSPYL